MKLPLSWLKEFIDLPHSPAQIAQILTLAGLEVDAVDSILPSFSQVVIGEVLSTEKHPDADKLCVAQVTDGIETYQVVCGAPNCRPGIKTAFAMIGATLTEEDGKTFKIKKSKLRGVESSGMLCAALELNLGANKEGIIEFDRHMTTGTDIASLYADTVFEISLTPNLGHCASVLGVARELSAATGIPLKMPTINLIEEDLLATQMATVSIHDFERCSRYACRLIQNLTIAPSPEWLVKRLELSGVRSINTVVDVTNYVMLELGHPLHAFDYDELTGHEIIVRCASKGEKFITLDGKERTLTEEDLLICDKNKAIAIAGVMGGKNSEVSDKTHTVLIEAAYFSPTAIRRTSKRLGLQTDASKRFERGTDFNSIGRSLSRAAMLLQQIAGGKVTHGIIDVKESETIKRAITCRLSRANNMLGTHLGASEVGSIFQRLEMPNTWDGQDTFNVEIPSYRLDVQSEIDLIEELARIYGFENIPKTEPRYHSSTLNHAPIYLFEKEIRSRLMAEGLQELLTCDLIGPSSLELVQGDAMGKEAIVHVMNPTSIEQSILRTSMLPGLLNVVKYNVDRQNHDISGFEVGRIHFKDGGKYIEQTVAGIVLTGKSRPHLWDQKGKDVDFYELKGIVENLMEQLEIHNYVFKENDLRTFHTGRQAAIMVKDLEVGSLGEIHPSIQRRLDVPGRIMFAELNLNDLYPLRGKNAKMKDIPIYPTSERDWTLTLKEETLVEQVLSIIRSVKSKLLESATLLDLYRSDKLGIGLKNVTFHFVYRDREKTISQEALELEHARIINESLRELKL